MYEIMQHFPPISPSSLVLQRGDKHATFRIPGKKAARKKVEPVFLPFAGCPHRCIYCNQQATTGRAEQTLDQAYDELSERLEKAHAGRVDPFELAFFGGTFTALPRRHLETLLQLAQGYKGLGLVERLRCSTRPDALSPDVLALLKEYGMDMVELGIQSFDDVVLMKSGRGYDGATLRKACEAVHDAGFTLGIQLLPGLPGSTRENFLEDVRSAVELKPECVRHYPCQVLKGTTLAEMYQRGDYIPWSLDATVQALAEALLLFWEQDIAVIRMGLAPEAVLSTERIAGPHHPALGQLVLSQAILSLVRRCTEAMKAEKRALDIPRHRLSDVLGQGRMMLSEYAKLGIAAEDILPWDEDFFQLTAL